MSAQTDISVAEATTELFGGFLFAEHASKITELVSSMGITRDEMSEYVLPSGIIRAAHTRWISRQELDKTKVEPENPRWTKYRYDTLGPWLTATHVELRGTDAESIDL